MKELFTGENQKRAIRYLLEALFLAGVVYLIYAVAGVKDMESWKYGIRPFLIAVSSLFLAQLALAKRFFTAFRGLPTVLFLLYALVFPLIQVGSAGPAGLPSEDSNSYFQMALGMALLLFFFLEMGRRFLLVRIPMGILSFAILFAAILNLLVYIVYYILFGDAFAVESMTAILLTNQTEARGFLMSSLGAAGIIGTAAVLLFLVVLCFGAIRKAFHSKTGKEILFNKVVVSLQVLTLLAGGLLCNHWLMRTFPGAEYEKAKAYIAMTDVTEKHKNSLADFTLPNAEQTLPHKLPGTVIVVIGESANRDHMKAFNPEYPAETTPWLSSQREGFYLFPKAYSCYPITVPALFSYLTNMNQYNGLNEENIASSDIPLITVTDIANLAGYRTYWITHKNRNTSVVPILTAASYKEYQTDTVLGFDEKLPPLLENIPKDGNNFIVIHLAGSHNQYTDRVPKDFPQFHYDNTPANIAEYDTTIRYSDKVMEEIFTYASEHLNLLAMIYCSDHGEDMVQTHHGGRAFTFDMVRIPLFIYLSPAYRAAYPDAAANLAAHEQDIFTNDLMYDTICGILRAPHPEYDSRYDLTSSSYDLSIEKAVTKKGTIRIADDLALKQ